MEAKVENIIVENVSDDDCPKAMPFSAIPFVFNQN
jgi:hypothetical protein